MTYRHRMPGSTDDDLLIFARRFAELAKRAHELLPHSNDASISDAILGHLGISAEALSTLGQNLPQVERPNVQLAVDEILGLGGQIQVLGLPPDISHFGGFSLPALVHGSFRGPTHAVPPVLDDVAIGVNKTLACVVAGIWLGSIESEGSSHPVAIGVHPIEQRGPDSSQLRVEIMAANTATTQLVRDQLTEARQIHNVYRGNVLAFTFSEFGSFGISFIERPSTAADEVILAPGDLDSIHRHTLGIAEHADALRAAGQHLKRGLLLYGPPGTGKTHTIGHLMAAMPDRTVVVLQGASVGALGQAAAIVRALPPSMLVIEDVDLIAGERSMHPMGGNPLLFQLLNEMDGLGQLDDVLFVLTTNRLDMLEPALAARPGRIDHAVEIALPDPGGRRQLLELYLRDVDHSLGSVDETVTRLDGVTGAFIKELVRRAVSNTIVGGATTMTDAHLNGAVEEMLDAASPIHAAMLGGPQSAGHRDAGPDGPWMHASLPPGAPPGPPFP